MGGGHKQLYRIIDFKRDIIDMPARVAGDRVRPEPHRQSGAARVHQRREALHPAPEGLKVGATIVSPQQGHPNDFTVGNNFPALELIPPSTKVHCVELVPGRGAQMARSAGTSLELVAVENGQAQLKMPSGELRFVNPKCRATIGVVGNGDHNKQSLGKAGRNRWLGRRPHVRGVAMNPVDHPNGGGQGKSKGGGGRQQLVSPWGQLAKGFPTRRRRQALQQP
jgi:large subunit ribosomal protein L2